jgi:hypothetical protein
VTIEYEDGTAYEAINEVRLAVVSPETAKNNRQQLKKSESKLILLYVMLILKLAYLFDNQDCGLV